MYVFLRALLSLSSADLALALEIEISSSANFDAFGWFGFTAPLKNLNDGSLSLFHGAIFSRRSATHMPRLQWSRFVPVLVSFVSGLIRFMHEIALLISLKACVIFAFLLSILCM